LERRKLGHRIAHGSERLSPVSDHRQADADLRSAWRENSLMLNWRLLKNPVNWLIVFLMLAVGVIGFYAVAKNLPGSS
jgi:hypothetical protein